MKKSKKSKNPDFSLSIFRLNNHGNTENIFVSNCFEVLLQRLKSAWNPLRKRLKFKIFLGMHWRCPDPSPHWFQSVVIHYVYITYIYIYKCAHSPGDPFKLLLGIKAKLDLHQNWTVENMCDLILWLQYKIQEFFSEWYTSRVNMRFLLESVLLFGVFDETCAIGSS